MSPFFAQLSAVVGIATLVAFCMRLLRQPLILAYIFAGVLLGIFRVIDVRGSETLEFLPQIGIAFLLFMVGMELDLRELRKIGKSIFSTSALQVLVTFSAVLLLGIGLGIALKESVYLAIGLGFSSTILVVKFLTERKAVHTLYGRLAIGILLVEDLIAVVVLMLLSIYQHTPSLTQNFVFFPFAMIVLKGAAVLYLLLFLSKRVLPWCIGLVASSTELLMLATIAWCLGFVSLTTVLGFSSEIGAFLAGVALASSPFRYQIAGTIRPLRDFFIAIFFIDLGTRVQFFNVQKLLGPIAVFSLFVLFSKPLIFMTILGRQGYPRFVYFMSAVTLTQVSEFSMILAVAGSKVGHVSAEGATIVTMVGLITMTISSLGMTHANELYRHLRHALGIFEKAEKVGLEKPRVERAGHVVLVGAHRIGELIVRMLQQKHIPFVVVDSNPDIMKRLEKQGAQTVFGSIGDPEVMDQVGLEKAKLVISTITDFQDNENLLRELRSHRSSAKVIMAADFPLEAYELYKRGVHYVMLPYTEAGTHIVHLLGEHIGNLSFFDHQIETRMKDVLRWAKIDE